jgi:hypothetical protein
MTCSEGCQACISVPAAEFGPAAVNSSALKTPRFPCRCWGFGVFGQALIYIMTRELCGILWVLTVQVVPAVADPEALGRLAREMNGVLSLHADDGRYFFTQGAQQFAFQPGYEVFAGHSRGLSDEPVKPEWAGHVAWTDEEGRTQVLHPVTADFEQLVAEVKKLDKAGRVRGNADGSVTLAFGGEVFTLLPDYALVDVPEGKATEAYWFGEDGRVFVRYPRLNKAQGFVVR